MWDLLVSPFSFTQEGETATATGEKNKNHEHFNVESVLSLSILAHCRNIQHVQHGGRGPVDIKGSFSGNKTTILR